MNSPDQVSIGDDTKPETVDTNKATDVIAYDNTPPSVKTGIVASATCDSSSDTATTTTCSVAEDVSSDADLRFGYCCFRPSWLQWLNTAAGAVAFICLANALQGFANGIIGVILSTIEKRFDLSSSDSSIIAIGYEIGPIPIILFFTFFGDRSALT
jgi:Organic Anion Transporter Polypeptide (OATP) family